MNENMNDMLKGKKSMEYEVIEETYFNEDIMLQTA
jgi:hypothetical protein